jgi:lysophospholipase L1-like esterase
MSKKLCSWLIAICLVFLTNSARAQAIQPIPLATGQLVAFLGDSITQQDLYTRDVELLLNSYYPSLHLRFVNVGWSGRHAAHLQDPAVLDRDLLRLKPDVVLIMFGMNDGWYRVPADPTATAAYQSNMANLVHSIHAARPQTQIVLLTPTISDPNRTGYLQGYNETLGQMAAIVTKLGAAENLPVIDLYAAMLPEETAAQALDPKCPLTLDGIHPTPIGHWLIAAIIGKAFGVAPPAQMRVEIDPLARNATTPMGTDVVDIHDVGVKHYFTLRFTHVPVTLPLEARGATVFPLVEQSRDHQWLAMNNLPPDALYGVYRDSYLIGRYHGSELAQGIEWTMHAGEDPLTKWVMQLALAKYNYRWVAWRAPDTGIAATDPRLADAEATKMLDAALARMTKRADEEEYRAIELAKNMQWMIAPETPVDLPAWEVNGPYIFQSFSTIYLPETRTPVEAWTTMRPDANGVIDLKTAFSDTRNSVVYSRMKIYLPRAAQLSFSIGAYGPLKVWVNGEEALARDESQTVLDPLQDTVLATLKPGWNTLLLRETRGTQSWGFTTHAYLCGLTPEEMLQVTVAPK